MKTMMLAALVAMMFAEQAWAFPPTATVSPGYDRALAESRRARGAGQPYIVAPAHIVRHPRH